MDIRIISALISAVVAFLILIISNFIIEPKKQRKQQKKEKLKNFYAPLYTLIILRMQIVEEIIVRDSRLTLGSISSNETTSKEYLQKFFLENSGYASDKLIVYWVEYNVQPITKEKTTNFITTIIKEYNKLKKDLKLDYDHNELETGLPSFLREQGYNIDKILDIT